MSYANVVASGSTAAPTPVEQPIVQEQVSPVETESTPEPIETESKSGEEDSTIQTQLPSPSPSPKAEKKQKEVNLAPAPVPQVSAWGSASSSRSNSNVSSVDTRHWPSPQELGAQPQVNGASKKISAVKTSKEKWVPFKASVVLPQPGSKKANGQKRNSNKNNNVLSNNNNTNNINNNNKQAHNDAKKRKNKTEKRTDATKESPKAESKAQQADSESSTKSEEKAQDSSASLPSKPQDSSATDKSATSSNNNAQTSPQYNNNNNHNNQHHHNNHHNNNLRYQNNQFHPQQAFIPFQPFPVQNAFQGPNGQRQFRPYNNNRRFNKYNNNGINGGHYRQNNNANNFIPYQNRRHVAHLNKSSEPLLSLIKQIEYYFSIENLLKDIFLRKNMNSEGWLDLTVISSFYRMNVLSAGDFNLVRKAIDELNGELLELAEFGTEDAKVLKVRVKENYQNWVLSADQRELKGQDETAPLHLIEPVERDTAVADADAPEEQAEATESEAGPVAVEASN